ncbi:MAG: DUF3857 domain-containing protein [Ferruginibacter sp.]
MKQLILALSVLAAATVNAQPNYSVLTIPDSLRKNADVVTREESVKFIIKDINTARYEVHEVVTILNEAGSRYLNFDQFSYEFQSLDDAEIKVYDALGIKKTTYSKKDMTSINYGEGLVPEGKVTYISVNAPSYPITIEKNYTVRYKGLFSYPGYNFQPPYHAVEKEVFEVEAPADLSFRFKLLNCNYQPQVLKESGKELYRWEVKNLPAYRSEKNSGGSDYYVPQLLLAPNKFQLDSYAGDMTSWKNFGAWIRDLYLKTTDLKDDRKEFFKALVKNAGTDKEKARILYDYLQTNMRYVSIQLGIGGLRPFPASFVDSKKYGDCKALSNFLKSALDAVGVKSNVVIIEGSMQPGLVLEDFPANTFNHVILCVPNAADTTWLECTSTTLPFGELGPFTENRKAMLVTDDGGVLVNTPLSKYKSNAISFSTEINVNDDGGALVTAQYRSTGDERNDLLMGFHDLKEDDKKRLFIRHTEWKQPDNFELSFSPRSANPYLISTKMEYENIASFKAGSKLFLEPRLYQLFDKDIPETEKRRHDYYFDCPYEQTDTTIYKMPAGYTAESLPKDKNLQYPFAAYNATYKWDAEKHELICIATVQVKERVVKAADYPRLLDFKKQVLADASEKIVMKR